MSDNVIGYDPEREAYLFAFDLWITASPSLVQGYMCHVFEKDGQYALPFDSSLLFPFARACGWRHVVSFPSHHDIVSGPPFDGTERFMREFRRWLDEQPLPQVPPDDD